jgi:hypothetical protein
VSSIRHACGTAKFLIRQAISEMPPLRLEATFAWSHASTTFIHVSPSEKKGSRSSSGRLGYATAGKKDAPHGGVGGMARASSPYSCQRLAGVHALAYAEDAGLAASKYAAYTAGSGKWRVVLKRARALRGCAGNEGESWSRRSVDGLLEGLNLSLRV